MTYVYLKDFIALLHFMEPVIDRFGNIHAFTLLPNVNNYNIKTITDYRKIIECRYGYDNYVNWLKHMNNAKNNKLTSYNIIVHERYNDEELIEYMKSLMPLK